MGEEVQSICEGDDAFKALSDIMISYRVYYCIRQTFGEKSFTNLTNFSYIIAKLYCNSSTIISILMFSPNFILPN